MNKAFSAIHHRHVFVLFAAIAVAPEPRQQSAGGGGMSRARVAATALSSCQRRLLVMAAERTQAAVRVIAILPQPL
ncbi:hypothetical protein SKAU_G00427710 [Synaphobranchus kaupii]|uniref:Secreted protein n=1 Tax=Synaphobranchus kaupii TaxID=118154 RepID=A0A9Q1E4R7_SYNKA|nr:hypothetical protein SKAU_G00427710 [Synaphobranchus kaupii]